MRFRSRSWAAVPGVTLSQEYMWHILISVELSSLMLPAGFRKPFEKGVFQDGRGISSRVSGHLFGFTWFEVQVATYGAAPVTIMRSCRRTPLGEDTEAG
jgi:hypothetical protein